MRNYFKDTGVPNAMEWAKAGAGTLQAPLIDAPGEGKKIVICDIIIYDESGGGKEIIRHCAPGAYSSAVQMIQLREGSHSFTSPIALPINRGLAVDSGTGGTTLEILVTYYIQG